MQNLTPDEITQAEEFIKKYLRISKKKIREVEDEFEKYKLKQEKITRGKINSRPDQEEKLLALHKYTIDVYQKSFDKSVNFWESPESFCWMFQRTDDISISLLDRYFKTITDEQCLAFKILSVALVELKKESEEIFGHN